MSLFSLEWMKDLIKREVIVKGTGKLSVKWGPYPLMGKKISTLSLTRVTNQHGGNSEICHADVTFGWEKSISLIMM